MGIAVASIVEDRESRHRESSMNIQNSNNKSGARPGGGKGAFWICLGIFTGMTFVSTPLACGTGAVRISRGPMAQTGHNDVNSGGNASGFEDRRVEVDPSIEHVPALRESPVSEGDPARMQSEASFFQMKKDSDFCLGLKSGECLTLVIQVPGSLIQSSMGLGVLGLSLGSKSYSDLLHRTCSEGLRVGLPVVEAGLPLLRRNGVAKRLFSPFKRSRCVYQVLTSESDLPPRLAANETGLKVRLVDFSLQGNAVSTNPVLGRFEFRENKMLTRFHDVSVRPARPEAEWEPVRGGWNFADTATYSGVFRTSSVGVTIQRGLIFNANGFGIASYLNSVIDPFLNESTRTQSLVKAKVQIEMMRMAVRSLRQGRSVVTSSLVLLGMGLDAVKQICSSPGSDCRVENSERNLVSQLDDAFENGQPLETESKALLIDGLKYVPLGLVRAVFEHADERSFVSQMSVPVAH